MKLQENPFYILNLPCSAGRREIISAAEDLSFMLDAGVCTSAQNELINLSKRLTAELGWFIDLDKEQIERIHEQIEKGTEIQTDSLHSLSRFNAALYNFSISSESDIYELGYAILDMDEQYANLDANEICELLNQSRTNAKISTLTEQEVSAEINNKRDDIRQSISEKLYTLDQDSYIELITMLAEKCIADESYADGIILADVIDQYEVRMQSQIEESADRIEAHIARIQQLANDEAITENVNALIRQVQAWDNLAQPLQLKSQASGMPHGISERLGRSLRKLALYLQNEKGRTDDALALVDAMKDVFAELASLYDLFDSDSVALNDILQGKKEDNEVLAELDAVRKLADSLKSFATSATVDTFISRVKSLDVKLKSLALDSETRTKARESLCYIARDAAIELHNNKHQTMYALTISEALSSEFGDIPTLKLELLLDTAALNKQLPLSDRALARNSTSHTGSSGPLSNPGCLIAIVVAVLIIMIISAISSMNSSTSQTPTQTSKSPTYISKSSTNTSQPSYTYSQKTGGYSGNNNGGNKSNSASPRLSTSAAPNQPVLDALKKEIDDMEKKLDGLSSDIDDYESQLKELKDDIDYYKSQYYATGDDFYYNAYDSAIDDYNDIYEDYSDAIDAYNSLYSKYTNAIDNYNSRIGY